LPPEGAVPAEPGRGAGVAGPNANFPVPEGAVPAEPGRGAGVAGPNFIECGTAEKAEGVEAANISTTAAARNFEDPINFAMGNLLVEDRKTDTRLTYEL